jgi:hypothetical protein
MPTKKEGPSELPPPVSEPCESETIKAQNRRKRATYSDWVGAPPRGGGPGTWVMAEGALLRMLKEQYGWLQPAPGELVKPRRAA